MQKNAPKPLGWKEPLQARHRYYPLGAGVRWFYRSFGILFLLAMLSVAFFSRGDAGGLPIAFGLLGFVFFALAMPAIDQLSSATIEIGEGGVFRSATARSLPLMFASLVKGEGMWYWLNITHLTLNEEDFGGKTFRVLRVWGRNDQLLGAAGVAPEISNEQIAEWAGFKGRPFEIQQAQGFAASRD